jgi:hypothetical protein
MAGTVFQGTKLPLTVWFLAIYVISQARTGLSALALKRHLGVSYPTAWLIHHKLMRAMGQREERYVLGGEVLVDDAYLGGERTGGKAGRGSENKVPFLPAVSLSEEGHPLRAKLALVPGFTLKAIAGWAKATSRRGIDGAAGCSGLLQRRVRSRLRSPADRRRRAKAQGAARVEVGQHDLGQFQGQPFGLLPRASLPQVWRSVPRRFRLPIQPSIRSQHFERGAPDRRSNLCATAPAGDLRG